MWNVLINFRLLKLHSIPTAVTGHVNIRKQILLWNSQAVFKLPLFSIFFKIIFHFSGRKKQKNKTFEVHLHFKRIDISHFFLKILKLGQKAVFSECTNEILLCKDKTKTAVCISRNVTHHQQNEITLELVFGSEVSVFILSVIAKHFLSSNTNCGDTKQFLGHP